MSNAQDMKIHESLALLNDLHLIEWLTRDVEESTRTIVNALVSELLETDDPVEYQPASWSDAVIEVMTTEFMPEDWFDLVNGNFYEAVELNSQSIGFCISNHDSMMTDEEAKQAALTYAKEWESKAKFALKQAINGTARR